MTVSETGSVARHLAAGTGDLGLSREDRVSLRRWLGGNRVGGGDGRISASRREDVAAGVREAVASLEAALALMETELACLRAWLGRQQRA